MEVFFKNFGGKKVFEKVKIKQLHFFLLKEGSALLDFEQILCFDAFQRRKLYQKRNRKKGTW